MEFIDDLCGVFFIKMHYIFYIYIKFILASNLLAGDKLKKNNLKCLCGVPEP